MLGMAPLQGHEVVHAASDPMTLVTTVATVVMAVAVVFGGLKWLFSQGGQSRAHIEALNRNVKATENLTEQVKELDTRMGLNDAELAVSLQKLTDRVLRAEFLIEGLSKGGSKDH